ncbi:MAG TPA: hypothetical protein PKA93_08415 [Arachnia sp.]|nr:hypothetical protein [Arachnia sp.]
MFSFVLPERDESGANALAELRDRSVSDVAGAASQAVEHVRSFFTSLRAEVGFYLAASNLAAALEGLGGPLCVPDPRATEATTAEGLYDPCLALRTASVRSATTSVSARETCWSSPARIAGASRRCSGPSGRRS